MRDQSLLNAIQTIAIVFFGIVLTYVVWRLERVLTLVLATLRTLAVTHKDLIQSQDAMEDSITDVWKRIDRIERRQNAGNAD